MDIPEATGAPDGAPDKTPPPSVMHPPIEKDEA
jgi:hypothetical protein